MGYSDIRKPQHERGEQGGPGLLSAKVSTNCRQQLKHILGRVIHLNAHYTAEARTPSVLQDTK